MTNDALSILQALGEQLRARLLELPEYRALAVIDRTILDLTHIVNQSSVAAPTYAAPPAKAAEPPMNFAAPPPRLEAPPAPVSSQGRMATAIAETIAARTASFNAPNGAASRFSQALSAAS